MYDAHSCDVHIFISSHDSLKTAQTSSTLCSSCTHIRRSTILGFWNALPGVAFFQSPPPPLSPLPSLISLLVGRVSKKKKKEKEKRGKKKEKQNNNNIFLFFRFVFSFYVFVFFLFLFFFFFSLFINLFPFLVGVVIFLPFLVSPSFLVAPLFPCWLGHPSPLLLVLCPTSSLLGVPPQVVWAFFLTSLVGRDWGERRERGGGRSPLLLSLSGWAVFTSLF